MAVFLLDTWTPVKDKRKENDKVVEKILRRETSQNLKTRQITKILQTGLGGKPAKRRVLITEFASLTEMDKFFHKLRKNRDWQK